MTHRTYKRPGKTGLSWSYCLDLGKDQAGVRVRETKHGFETKKGANDAAQLRIEAIKAERARAAAEAKREPIAVKPALGAFLDETWFPKYAGRECSPKTFERYRQLATYLSAAVREAPIDKLTTAILDDEAIRLKDSGGEEGKPLSAKTVKHIFGVLKGALNQAVRLELISTNRATLCTLPKLDEKRAIALDVATTEKLLRALRDHWLHPIIFFAAATGCRRGEILALRWSELDLEKRVARIVRSIEQTKDGLRIKRPKNNEERDCPLPASLVEVLVNHREVRLAEYKRMFGADYYAEGDLVFPAPNGTFLKPDTITAEVCSRAAKAGLKGVGLHSMRHSHGSQLLAAGVPLPTVSERLGHKDPAITARVYAHSFKEQETAAAEIWDNLMKQNARKISGQQMATNLPQVIEKMAALTGFEPVSKP